MTQFLQISPSSQLTSSIYYDTQSSVINIHEQYPRPDPNQTLGLLSVSAQSLLWWKFRADPKQTQSRQKFHKIDASQEHLLKNCQFTKIQEFYSFC